MLKNLMVFDKEVYMAALEFLTSLASILLIGIICTLISKKLRMSNILFLIIAGMLLGRVKFQGVTLIHFPGDFLTSIGILALVMIVFDSSSRFKLEEFDELSIHALKLTGYFLMFNMLILTFSLIFVFGLGFGILQLLLAILFSTLMSGTDPAAILSMLGQTKNKLLELIEIESLINTPLIVLLPFIILDLINKITANGGPVLLSFFNEALPFFRDFLLRLVAGIGAGILIGIILFKVMKKQYSVILSPLSLITSALLTYIIAENLGGNGVLAVTTLGLFFGNVYVKQKLELQEFSSIFSNALEILVFALVGLIINVPFTVSFISKSFFLFLIYLGIRYLAVHVSFKNYSLGVKEKFFMTLNVQKGIAVAVVVFTLSILKIEGISLILNLTLMFMLYSIIISTIVLKLSHHFVKGKEVIKEKASKKKKNED